jgi:hypothetical protein
MLRLPAASSCWSIEAISRYCWPRLEIKTRYESITLVNQKKRIQMQLHVCSTLLNLTFYIVNKVCVFEIKKILMNSFPKSYCTITFPWLSQKSRNVLKTILSTQWTFWFYFKSLQFSYYVTKKSILWNEYFSALIDFRTVFYASKMWSTKNFHCPLPW